ncbi:hypothetical protein KUTeg_008683 [Tegillarca granosa]|uniref:Pacifastin domain-containing protein n=1 Tax=Tegillarca granosa TaxID=220873 RepID=A0ABQ9F9U6_TEGGR|nr:hypothetical protein KUTeg_008683 [Tegillarca granosa]
MAGQSWTASDGCNTCYCSAHAGGALCTEMACVTTKPLVDVKPVATCLYNKVTYVAGDKYMATDGCNTCVCGSNGMTSCTKVFCQRGSCDYNGKRFYVGEMFDAKDGCNTCHCVTQGHVACTEMYCIPFMNF